MTKPNPLCNLSGGQVLITSLLTLYGCDTSLNARDMTLTNTFYFSRQHECAFARKEWSHIILQEADF